MSAKPLWKMQDQGERYLSHIELFREQDDKEFSNKFYLKIQCQGNGVFEISDNSIRIDWQTSGTDSAHYFQTLGLALWLELNQVLCLHANALAYKDTAIALVAPSRTGKTTLTAALSQVGFGLMTDDMLALHQSGKDYVIYPSWPVARMWPDTLRELLDDTAQKFKKVHQNFEKRIVRITEKMESGNPMKFCSDPRVLSTVYLLNRRDPGESPNGELGTSHPHCEIVPVPAAEAAMALIQNSVLGSCYGSLGLEQQRVKAIAKLLNNVTVKKISYESGINHLREVCSALKEDIAS